MKTSWSTSEVRVRLCSVLPAALVAVVSLSLRKEALFQLLVSKATKVSLNCYW